MYSQQITIQVLDLLESPLVGTEGENWVQNTVHMSKQFTQFLNAQAASAQACTLVDSWKPLLKPLRETKRRPILDELWRNINKVRSPLTNY